MVQSPSDNTPNRVCELVVNLDDTPGEVVGHATATLLHEGALDVWTTPITMKQGRPGVMLSVLAPLDQRNATARRLLELTGSFGVRYRAWDRLVLDRTMENIATPLGDVAVKVGSLEGHAICAKPEFREVVKLAEQSGVSVKRASDLAHGAAAARIADADSQGGSQ